MDFLIFTGGCGRTVLLYALFHDCNSMFIANTNDYVSNVGGKEMSEKNVFVRVVGSGKGGKFAIEPKATPKALRKALEISDDLELWNKNEDRLINEGGSIYQYVHENDVLVFRPKTDWGPNT